MNAIKISAFLALFVPLACQGFEGPEALTSTSQPISRNFFIASWDGVRDTVTAPVRTGPMDLLWLAPAGLGLGVLLNNDVPLYHNMHDSRQDWLDHSMPLVSALGDGLAEFGLTAIANKYGDVKLRRTSAIAMQGLLTVSLLEPVFKYGAWANRPSQDDTAHRFLDYSQSTQGFPSGHSLSAFCVAEVFGQAYGRQWTYPLACLVGYSRVYNAAHFPSDVWAGALIGVVAGWQSCRAADLDGPPAINFSLVPLANASLLVARVNF